MAWDRQTILESGERNGVKCRLEIETRFIQPHEDQVYFISQGYWFYLTYSRKRIGYEDSGYWDSVEIRIEDRDSSTGAELALDLFYKFLGEEDQWKGNAVELD